MKHQEKEEVKFSVWHYVKQPNLGIIGALESEDKKNRTD